MPKKPTSVARTQFPPSGSRKNAIRPSSKDAQPPARYLHFDKSREVDSLLDQAERARSCLVAGSASLRKALETRLRGGLLVSPAPRLFVRAQYWGGLTSTQRHRHVLLGLGRLHPSWVACGISAAVAHELQVPYRLLDGKTHVTGCDKHAKTWGEIRVHKASREIEPVIVGGIPVTSVPQTALDCARLVDARGGLAIADSALRVCGMAREELVDYVEAHGRGLRGITLAREVASMADARSANGGESIARRVMHELGYALPELQVCFADPMDPQRRYYADFVWPHAEGGLVIGELDGVEKYMDPEMTGPDGLRGAVLRERRRESRLTITRAAIARFSYAEVLDLGWFDRLLATFGVPREREPIVAVPVPRKPRSPEAPAPELVPLEAYGLD